MDPRGFRRNFVAGLLLGLRVVWPILSGLLVLIFALGVAAGLLEVWSMQESVYFSFVSALTIGYGDFVPQTLLGRALAIAIGVCGVLVKALVAAIAVKALTDARGDGDTGVTDERLRLTVVALPTNPRSTERPTATGELKPRVAGGQPGLARGYGGA